MKSACASCGAELPTHARFCRSCGAAQREVKPPPRDADSQPPAADEGRKEFAFPFPIGRTIVVLAVAAAVAYFAISDGAGPAYDGSMSGQFSKTQYVGLADPMSVVVHNDGTTAMPNVTIELTDHAPWVVQSVAPDGKSLGDGLYSFGPLPPGDELDATLTLVPKEAGNFTIGIYAYGDVSDGTAQGLHSIPKGDPIDGLSQGVAIVP
jgi:hypothetical protein